TANAAAEDVTRSAFFHVERDSFLGVLRCSDLPTDLSPSSSNGCLHLLLHPALASYHMPLAVPEGIYPSPLASWTNSKGEGQRMDPCSVPRGSADASSLHLQVIGCHASTSRCTLATSTVPLGVRAPPFLAGQSGP
ncbi:hypothetical protein T08_4223, partial [Trichinella sp. T8]